MDASPDRPANDEPSNMPPSDAVGNPLPPDVPAGPPPEPPPLRRRVSLAKNRIRRAKQRIGSPPGICYDSGAHLL